MKKKKDIERKMRTRKKLVEGGKNLVKKREERQKKGKKKREKGGERSLKQKWLVKIRKENRKEANGRE